MEHLFYPLLCVVMWVVILFVVYKSRTDPNGPTYKGRMYDIDDPSRPGF